VLRGFERIDLTGNGDNTLSFGVKDLQDAGSTKGRRTTARVPKCALQYDTLDIADQSGASAGHTVLRTGCSLLVGGLRQRANDAGLADAIGVDGICD